MFIEKILLNFSASYFIPNNRIKNVLDFLFLISRFSPGQLRRIIWLQVIS